MSAHGIIRQQARSVPLGLRSSLIPQGSSGAVGKESEQIDRRVHDAQQLTPTFQGVRLKSGTPDEPFYDALASFKIFTAQIAMHLDDGLKARFFSQLDGLLDRCEWDEGDALPTLPSFATLLRMLVLLNPDVRPGLGATSSGHFVAAWTKKKDRLTIECLPGDAVRWSVMLSDENGVERAAGIAVLVRLAEVLAPYSPQRWFARAE